MSERERERSHDRNESNSTNDDSEREREKEYRGGGENVHLYLVNETCCFSETIPTALAKNRANDGRGPLRNVPLGPTVRTPQERKTLVVFYKQFM